MTNDLELVDLGEMLGASLAYKECGFKEFTINAEHAIEILERLIAYEQEVQ